MSETNSKRKKCLAGNWKMNHGPAKTGEFFTEFKKNLSTTPHEVLFFVPAVSMTTALECAKGTSFRVGSQNAHFEKSGAFTGELSGPLLQEIGIHDVLIGHSERRQYFGETDETVNLRTKGLLDQNMRVMMCVGETRSEREANQTQTVLIRQTRAGLKEISLTQLINLRIAYEPVWAIGTGLVASVEQAVEAHQIIRTEISQIYGELASQSMQILYGGSVSPDNAKSLLSQSEIDGALVGGASLKADSFSKIVLVMPLP